MTSAYLLDTHVVLWYLRGDARLKPRARRLIESGKHTLVLSVASLWEVSLKYRAGKLASQDGWDALARDIADDSPWTLLPITAAHVLRQAQIPSLHTDPFDRMLVAQALVEGLTLVTSDAQLLRYPVKTLKV